MVSLSAFEVLVKGATHVDVFVYDAFWPGDACTTVTECIIATKPDGRHIGTFPAVSLPDENGLNVIIATVGRKNLNVFFPKSA
jgi:hypothetical protein